MRRLTILPQAVAERQRRKEEKRAGAAGNDSNDLEKSPTPEDIDDVDEKDGQGFDGIMSLRPAPIPKNKENSNAVKERIPAIPVFPGPPTLREVVQKADVVLHVVDARDPAAGISDVLAEAAHDKLTVLLNKIGVFDMWTGFSESEDVIDTVPRESLVQWLVHLRTSFTVLPFRVSSAFMPSGTPFEPRNKNAKPMSKDDALGLAGLWTHLDNLAQTKNDEELVVAVTGVTNVSVRPDLDPNLISCTTSQGNRPLSTRFSAQMYSQCTIRIWRCLPKGRTLRRVRERWWRLCLAMMHGGC